ncbi:MAG: hypothetical protein PUC30_00510 [Lachnospiraceae bacterium]|nr:hypothetical protein [Lachnospiraceae bacterium]
MTDILNYAKEHFDALEQGGISSNEIRFFEYDGKKYVFKKPLMVGDNLSPFWQMMKNVFSFTFEKQNKNLPKVYEALKDNPHIPFAPLIAADETAMIYGFLEGASYEEDAFPEGTENAYRLGQFIGYNHQIAHKGCGILGTCDVTDFFSNALSHMEQFIQTHWNSTDEIDRKVQLYFKSIRKNSFQSARYSLIMADMSADQFLYKGEDIAACVDLDAYVIGPVEWELAFLHNQVRDWDSFTAGYETYQPMPDFEELSHFFYFLMALNPYWDKSEMEEVLESLCKEDL